jgi:hypothetical protein
VILRGFNLFFSDTKLPKVFDSKIRILIVKGKNFVHKRPKEIKKEFFSKKFKNRSVSLPSFPSDLYNKFSHRNQNDIETKAQALASFD